MSEQPNDLMRALQELITNVATDQIRSSRQFNDFVQSIARGELNDREANDRILEFLSEANSRYITDISRLTVSFFQALRAVNRHYNDRFYDYVVRDNHQPERETDAAQHIDLLLSAAVGEDVQRSFVIENKQERDCDVSFAISEVTEVGESTSFRAPLHLQPARFTLRPGDEQVVTLYLSLLPELFSPDKQYQGTVLVQGHNSRVLMLIIEVLHPEQPDDMSADDQTGQTTPSASDDLTLLKGIGTNYAKALTRAGITSFDDLSGASDALLQNRLGNTTLGQALRYDWRGQARLAAQGNIAALADLQERLPLTNGKNGNHK
jgi:predicted flap endonuclease-1-like 5' DNA nuclease